MNTVTLEYDKSNPVARRKLAALLNTGLFLMKEESTYVPTAKEMKAHREMRDAILEHSRKSMAPIIARYL